MQPCVEGRMAGGTGAQQSHPPFLLHLLASQAEPGPGHQEAFLELTVGLPSVPSVAWGMLWSWCVFPIRI